MRRTYYVVRRYPDKVVEIRKIASSPIYTTPAQEIRGAMWLVIIMVLIWKGCRLG